MLWNSDSEYESGLDRGVYYSPSGFGEAWNGLTSVDESGDDQESFIYVDGVKTHQRKKQGYFSGTIQAYTYPESFFEDILLQRRPKNFGLTYRVMTATGYKIHLVYNISVSPSQFAYRQEDAEKFSWKFTSLPALVPNAARSAHLIIDVNVAYSWTTTALEDVLYGTPENPPRLPSPDEVFQIFEDNSILQIIDHGDGTWTAIGPDDVVKLLDPTTFEIDWPSAVYINAESYTVHSL